jgi:hypothetical protein
VPEQGGLPRLVPALRAQPEQRARLSMIARPCGRLLRVEHEIPPFVAGQQAGIDARPTGLTVIDVPGAQHGFDTGPDTEHGRAAVVRALTEVSGHLAASTAVHR